MADSSGSPTSISSATPADNRVSIGEKIGYGLGDTASNLYWKLFENFQLIFYTDVFGISAAAAGTMFFVTKLWDAINDPMMGAIADRTRSAWGRFRPWLIWMAVPFAVTGILTFHTPDLSPGGKLVYAYLTYTAVFMAYTAINIPYGALMGVISPHSQERTSVATYRFVLAFAGGLIVQKFTEPLVAWFGGTRTVLQDGIPTITVIDRQAGFFWTVVCYASVAVLLFVIAFLTTRERTQPVRTAGQSPLRDARDLLGNGPWRVLMFVGLFQILAGWTRGSATAYYFTYYVGQPFGNFLVAGTIASIAGMFLASPLKARLGSRNLMMLANLLVALCTACFWFLKPDQVGLMYALHIAASFVSGPVPILLWAMYADVADYSEWQNGRRATGLVFSAATFSQKLGGALGGAVPAWCLAAYSFREPVDGVQQPQSDFTIGGIILLMSLAPAAFWLGSMASMFFYRIHESLLLQIETDLAQRKTALSPGEETPTP